MNIGFTLLPMPLTVAPGVNATFRCNHSEAIFIGWRVNNVTVNCDEKEMLPGILTKLDTLIVPAQSQYSGAVVECVAFFGNGTSSMTPPVTLTVQGIYLVVQV